MKCTFVNCANEGEPTDGYDFFACDACLDQLEMILERLALEQYSKN